MMLIRPPVVRQMRRNLWVSMTARPENVTPRASAGQEADTVDVVALLKELGELRASGVLTEEEFAKEKAKLLD